jgi:RNA polymerase primary sigma factor
MVVTADPEPGSAYAAPDGPSLDGESAGPLPDSMQLFLTEVSRYRLLTPPEEISLARRIECGDKAAKDRMINSNLRLVVSIAKRYQHTNMALLDIVQEGILGLIRAVEKFDWRLGNRFSTYATWWIREAIERGIANRARIIRMPVYMVERERQITRAERALVAELGRDPTDEEVAARVRIDLDQIREVRSAARAVASLDKPVGEDESTPFGDLLVSDEIQPADEVEVSLGCATLRRTVEQLPDNERSVVKLRFGIGGQPNTIEQVVQLLGISRDRVRRLEAQGLARLGRMPEIAALRG